jgi:hypothetical protein
VGLRLYPDLERQIDAWASKQADEPSRPEAIRRLVEQALAGKGAPRPPSKEAAHKALKMAARELEPLGDKTLPPEERDRRKRALIRGPKEFRDIRGDQPRKKG